MWSDKELAELQDHELSTEARRYKREIDEEWLLVKALLEKYPGIFSMSAMTKQLFIFVYSNVVTRCFGWSLPCTMMVPVADSLNHGAVDASNEMFNARLHPLAKAGPAPTSLADDVEKYTTKGKLELDFSDFNAPPSGPSEEVKCRAVKPIIVDEDVISLCLDMTGLNLKDKDYDIWNVYYIAGVF